MNKNYKYGVIFLALAPLEMTFGVSPAQAQVTPAADGTGSLVNQNGNQLGITGGQVSGDGANLFHSFDRFGLSQGQVANFLASPQIRNIFGRVVGGEASAIDGLLRVSGSQANLFLMNPAGILFGPNARLDLPAAFTATTANGIGFGGRWLSASGVNDYVRLLGSPDALSFTMPQSGSIANFGQLAVGQGQSLSLVGGTVLNLGSLSATGGNVTVAAVAGKQVARISPVGSLLSVEVPLTANGQANEWKLPVGSLPELLTGGGLVEANGIMVRPNGTIVLTASGKGMMAGNGDTIVSGKVDVSGSGVGGTATIVGDRVALVGATVEASGALGGGNVLVGGEFQGKGAIPNAKSTSVSQDSSIRVNALSQGNGGRAIVWADRSTAFSGEVEARGAGQDGNGGLVEISGRENLFFDGKVDLAAPFGQVGQVLFDPRDINIVAGLGAQDAEVADGQIFAADGGNADFQIGSTTLQGINGDITLQASRDINLGTSLVFGNQPGRNIEFVAGGNFNGTGQNITAPGQNVTLRGINLSVNSIDTSGVPNVATGNTSAAGNINLDAQGNISIGTISIPDEAGKNFLVSLRALSSSTSGSAAKGGDITLNSANGNFQALGLIQSFSLSQDFGSPGGSVTINAPQGNIVTGPIYSFSTSRNNDSASGGSVKIVAGQGISINPDTDPDNLNASIRTLSQSLGGKADKGGEVSLTVTNGSIDVGDIKSQSQACRAEGCPSGTNTHGLQPNQFSSNDGGNIFLTATGDIRTQEINSFSESFVGATGKAGNVTLISQNGNIVVPSILSFSLADGGTSGQGGEITLRSSGLIAVEDLLTQSVSWANSSQAGNGGKVDLQSSNGSITIREIKAESSAINGNSAGNAGSVFINSNGDITAEQVSVFSQVGLGSVPKDGSVGNGGNIQLISNTGNINVQKQLASWSRIFGNGTTGNAGSVILESTQGDIKISAINAFSEVQGNVLNPSSIGNGGRISLNANGEITTGYLTSASKVGKDRRFNFDQSQISNGNAGNAGSITLSSRSRNITTGGANAISQVTGNGNAGFGGTYTLKADRIVSIENALNTFSEVKGNGNSADGGSVSLSSNKDSITTSSIFTFSSSENGGNIVLTAPQDIQVTSLDAEGGNTGHGGNVIIQTGRFFRATATLSSIALAENASISTLGGTSGGKITILHGGGLRNSPFVVGDPSINGTAGAITTGSDNTILPVRSFPMSYRQGTPPSTIQILTPFKFQNADLYRLPDITGWQIASTQRAEQWLNQPIPKEEAALKLQVLEEQFTNEFATYLNLGQKPPLKTLDEIQATLQMIEQATGVRTALIYVFFVSEDEWKLLADPKQEREKPSQPKPEDRLQILLVTPTKALLRDGGIDDKKMIQQSNNLKLVRQNDLMRIECQSTNKTDCEETKKPIVSYKKVSGAAKDLYDRISDSQQDYKTSAQSLYQWIIKPIEQDLQDEKINHLAFLMPTGLRSIPLAALCDTCNGKDFIVSQYSVGLMPSFSLLLNTDYRDFSQGKMWAMGASQFFPDPNLPNDLPPEELPAAGFQLDTLINSQVWNVPGSRSFPNEKFTPEQLINFREKDVKIVHLITHAKFDSNLDNSYIYFWKQRKTLAELRELRLNSPPPPIELFFLSACQTAQGDEKSELGFAGTVVKAEVKTVLASLWSIRNRSTFVLSVEFYNQLKKRKNGRLLTKAEALKEAQKALIEGRTYISDDNTVLTLSDGKQILLEKEFPGGSPKFSHPSNWAGLTLIGTPW